MKFRFCLAGLILACTVIIARGEIIVPASAQVSSGQPLSSAGQLAIERFQKRIGQLTTGTPTLTGKLIELKVSAPPPAAMAAADPAVLRQSYRLIPGADRVTIEVFTPCITPPESLGLGYALGDLLRRLDVRDGKWGFVFANNSPQLNTPAMPVRELYIMNSNHRNPGLSLEFYNDEALRDYVDFLIEAGYSRLSFWRWSVYYQWPGPDPTKPNRGRDHALMKRLFEYAQARGLETYHQLTMTHVPSADFPTSQSMLSTGYYRNMGAVCWNNLDARRLIREVAEYEINYFAPVIDGYRVWFYDPGGCFCEQCKADIGKTMFEQLALAHEFATKVNPGAPFDAMLWPTWCFHEYQDKGIPVTKAEADAAVRRFQELALERFGPRGISISDTMELESSNVFSGLVDPNKFDLTGMLYTTMGEASEHAYPFARFRHTHLLDCIQNARKGGLKGGNLFVQYTSTNRPTVYTWGQGLYHAPDTIGPLLQGYARSTAKGPAAEKYVALLELIEQEDATSDPKAKDRIIKQARADFETLAQDPLFMDNRDWLRGYLIGQQGYLDMAMAPDDAARDKRLDQLKAELAPTAYADYPNVMKPALMDLQLKRYWRLEDGKILH